MTSQFKQIDWSLLIAVAILSLIMGIGFGGDLAYEKGYQNASSQNATWINKGIEIGKNQTLNNLTILNQIGNDYVLYNINQYGVVPIYYQNRVFQCTNISEVKR